MLLPWDYGVRNLARRPVRTVLTFFALLTVISLTLVVIGIIRGLERSLISSGDPDVVMVYAVSSEENIENSSIAASTSATITASLGTTMKRYGNIYASPEIYLGTRVRIGDRLSGLGLVRGVTEAAPLVRRDVQMIEGKWPEVGEVIIGKFVAAKLGADASDLRVGKSLEFEGQSWKISGTFTSQGSALEAEIWCNLRDFQIATKRQDISLVALRLGPNASIAEVELFCKQRTDLELRAMGEVAYYATLQKHYGPVKWLAWFVVALVFCSGVCAGLNMMFGAVAGRAREMAMLQAVGFRRRAVLISLVQEGLILASIASFTAGCVGLFLVNGTAIRFTMGAFALNIDAIAILAASAIGVVIGAAGAIPPALKILRADVVISLRAI